MSSGAQRIVIAAIAACALALPSAANGAQILEPTRTDDPKPGKCKPRNCSLREAVLAANKRPGPAVIKLKARRYRLEIPPITNADFEFKTGDLDVLGNAVIRGKGPRRTSINARGLDRILDMRSTGAKYAVRGLTLRRGDAVFTGALGDNPWGGAIQTFAAELSLKNVVMEDNHSPEFGGAIFAFDSVLRLRRVVMDDNDSDYGGGLYAERAALTIDRSTVSENIASVYGGGVYIPDGLEGKNGGVIRASTISDNTAGIGGGIMLDDDQIFDGDAEPTLDIVNSTIAGNQSSASGGGISAIQGAVARLDNTTVAYNAGDAGAGGGLHQSTSAVVEVRDTIIANNTIGDLGSGPACSGDFVNSGGNVITNSTAVCNLASTTPDAMVGPLGAYGGPTRTVSLLTGSPAIGAGTTCPARDQRGRARPATGCDSGAFERSGP